MQNGVKATGVSKKHYSKHNFKYSHMHSDVFEAYDNDKLNT